MSPTCQETDRLSLCQSLPAFEGARNEVAGSTDTLFRQDDFFPLLSTRRQLGISREQKEERKGEDKIVKEEEGG